VCAFDLIELDGEDVRRWPIERRKVKLGKLIRSLHPGIVLNEHYDGDGRDRVQVRLHRLRGHRVEAPQLALSWGRADCWAKVKNPAARAVTREAEEDWRR
jgi:hypothetical protein